MAFYSGRRFLIATTVSVISIYYLFKSFSLFDHGDFEAGILYLVLMLITCILVTFFTKIGAFAIALSGIMAAAGLLHRGEIASGLAILIGVLILWMMLNASSDLGIESKKFKKITALIPLVGIGFAFVIVLAADNFKRAEYNSKESIYEAITEGEIDKLKELASLHPEIIKDNKYKFCRSAILSKKKWILEFIEQSAGELDSYQICDLFSDLLSVHLNSSKKPDERSMDMVIYMINRVEDVNQQNLDRKTLLHYTARYRWPHQMSAIIVTRLVKKGARVNCRDKKGAMPLHSAFDGDANPLSIVDKLLEKGADINCIDFDGQTPLHYLVLNDLFKPEEQVQLAAYLVKKGADVTIKNKQGKPAWYYSKNKNLLNIIKKK